MFDYYERIPNEPLNIITTMDDNKKQKLIRRLAAGTDAAPRSIRAAAVRLMTGFSDEEDERLVTEYLESMYE